MDNWHKFFDGWTVFRTVKIQERFIKKILQYTDKNSRMLELAAGSGLTSFILCYSGRTNIWASDIDETLVEAIKNKFGLLCPIVDMFDINTNDKYYDCVFHQGALEHFNDEDIVRTLKEQGRASKYVIFDIPNGRRFDKTQEYGNERFMYVSKWKKLIREAGLELVEYDGRRLNKIFKYLPFNLENNDFINKHFGTSSIFVCRSKGKNEQD
jgi:2-polyprenyl-3-methyl-5-hydroxy-6-metoxy-1,4-benzoquinol methylase